MKKFWVIIFLCIGLSHTTYAQYSISNHSQSAIDLAKFASEPQLKNPNTAMWMSIGATVGAYIVVPILFSIEGGSYVAAAAGLFVLITAPSVGYLYSLNEQEFWRNSGVRLLGTGIFTIGSFIFFVSAFDSLFSGENENTGGEIFGSILMLGGAGIFIYSTFRDFINVRKKVVEYNDSLVQSIEVGPILDPVTNVYGAGIRINF